MSRPRKPTIRYRPILPQSFDDMLPKKDAGVGVTIEVEVFSGVIVVGIAGVVNGVGVRTLATVGVGIGVGIN
jgi:hypothetical protein